MHLCRRSLFSVESWNLRLINQFICLNFMFIWFFFAMICAFHVSFRSSVNPRYFTSLLIGRNILFSITLGQIMLRFVNVICGDFSWLTLIFHLSSHTCKRSMWYWRFSEAVCGSSFVHTMAVSSMNVATVVSFVIGMSAVNTRYERGLRRCLEGHLILWRSKQKL